MHARVEQHGEPPSTVSLALASCFEMLQPSMHLLRWPKDGCFRFQTRRTANMSRFSITLPSFLLLSIAVLSMAQTGPQAALIPACVVRARESGFSKPMRKIADHEQKSCDPAAIASVNCTNEDQYCHCVRQDGILSNISACANAECDNASRDIFGLLSCCTAVVTVGSWLTLDLVFTTLFGEVCQKFNITVPVLGSNSSGNGTNVTAVAPPQPSTEASTGWAGKAYSGGCLSWTLSGVLFVTAFAVLL
jgi:hypothetical protein